MVENGWAVAFRRYSEIYVEQENRAREKRIGLWSGEFHGFQEEGSTTTPFDMAVMNRIDRFHLALAVLRRVPGLGAEVHGVVSMIESMLETHHAYVREHGEDMPEIRDWRWRGPIGF